jgi:hypothetical protein
VADIQNGTQNLGLVLRIFKSHISPSGKFIVIMHMSERKKKRVYAHPLYKWNHQSKECPIDVDIEAIFRVTYFFENLNNQIQIINCSFNSCTYKHDFQEQVNLLSSTGQCPHECRDIQNKQLTTPQHTRDRT